MSRFGDEFKVIPKTVRIIAALLYVAVAVGISLAIVYGGNEELRHKPFPLLLLLIFGPGIFVEIWVLLVGYVYGDSKRRCMRHVMWTLLAIFIPDGIGIILYFVLRDPLARVCSRCGQLLKPGFTFCPHCGTAGQPTCPNCGKGVESGWANCPHCGAKLPTQALPSQTIAGTA